MDAHNNKATPIDTDHIYQALMGLLVMGFTAWAGVVYTMGRKALALLNDIKVELATVKSDIDHTEGNLNHHMDKPWHAGAGEKLASIEQRMDNFEKFIR